jgi:hypothetical protein
VLFYTKYTHPTQIFRGTDARTHARTHGRMDGRTDGRTENIYSIFRDKLMLLGEHVLDAADENFIPDDANRKEPPENIGKKNRKDPPETIEDRNSYAIIPPADLESKTKSNNGYSDGGVNAMLSLPFLADEVDGKEPKCQAFVAINYAPKIGGIGMYMLFFSFQSFVNVMHQLTIVFMFIVFIF